MERELWKSLYALALRLDKPWGDWLYSNADVAAVYFWGVLHDRSLTWATTASNWDADLCPQPLISESVLSRRLRKPGFEVFLRELESVYLSLALVQRMWLRIIDGKALTVSKISKDPDATFGRGAGGIERGYKLHAVWGGGPLPIVWDVKPLNVSEKRVARHLLNHLPGSGYVLADGEYDSNRLYNLAHQSGYQLLAKKMRGGLGHRRHSLWRLRYIAQLNSHSGRKLYRGRKKVECDFGNLTNFSGGYIGLPPFVRRLHRVRNWIHAKLLANAVRWFRKHKPAALALA
jgi:hypothetical protein